MSNNTGSSNIVARWSKYCFDFKTYQSDILASPVAIFKDCSLQTYKVEF